MPRPKNKVPKFYIAKNGRAFTTWNGKTIHSVAETPFKVGLDLRKSLSESEIQSMLTRIDMSKKSKEIRFLLWLVRQSPIAPSF